MSDSEIVHLPASSAAKDAFEDVSDSTRQRMWHGRLPMPVDRFERVMRCLQVPRARWADWVQVFAERRQGHDH